LQRRIVFLWGSIAKRPAAVRKYQLAPIPTRPFSANPRVPVCTPMGLAGPWPQVTVFGGLALGLLLRLGFGGAIPARVVRALFRPVEHDGRA
jgi:hypothetical protein